jgi:3-deoxy-manno-octulosonate cytidylyltransferase (CMP-KDO synthetase)
MLSSMKTVVIIPARYASTRLPGKPLLTQTGKPLIQHVVEAVQRANCGIDKIVVATDDQRIADAVVDFGGGAIMTSANCRTGTDRLAEAAAKLHLADDDIVVNVQGDEPEMPAINIQKLLGVLRQTNAPMATLATPMSPAEAANPNKVKVVIDRLGRALYFSRAAIPFDRDGSRGANYLLHLGIYAYRTAFLKQFAAMPATPAEECEKLEQLRALENGFTIAVAVVEHYGLGIDTPDDYARFVAKFRAG